MKLFGIIALALLSITSLVSAYPQKVNEDGDFVYWITGAYSGECDIQSVRSSSTNKKYLSVPTFFVLEGDKYYVRNILPGAFAGCNAETIAFNYGSEKKSIYLYDHALGYNKNIKKIEIYNQYISADPNAFSGVDAEIDGWNVKYFIKNQAERTLQNWGLPVNYKGYDEASTEARDKKMKDLYKLAKNINKYFRLDYSSNSANVANALITFKASVRGMHMVFRELAIAMGVSEDYILTGGDGSTVFWSYVRFDRDKWYDTWYNAELYMFDFEKNGDKNYEKFFQTNGQFVTYLKNTLNHVIYNSKIHTDPFSWYYYESRYGTKFYNDLTRKQNFDDYRKTLKDPGDRP